MAEFPTYEQMAKNVAEKALDEFLYDGKSIREWMKIIVEQEPKWIPVSERLPEDGTYLVTVERMSRVVEIKSFAEDLNKVDEFDFPKQKWGWYDYDSEYGYWEDTAVIAWMPLPEPYEPQERSDRE